MGRGRRFVRDDGRINEEIRSLRSKSTRDSMFLSWMEDKAHAILEYGAIVRGTP